MSIVAVCRSCNSQFKARDTDAGKRTRCPSCGQMLEVPAAGQATQPGGGQAQAQPAGQPSPQTGYPAGAPPQGYAPPAYGAPQPGPPQAGYAPQPEYGGQPQYAGHAEYAQAGYGQPAGYGPEPGYGQPGYGQPDFGQAGYGPNASYPQGPGAPGASGASGVSGVSGAATGERPEQPRPRQKSNASTFVVIGVFAAIVIGLIVVFVVTMDQEAPAEFGHSLNVISAQAGTSVGGGLTYSSGYSSHVDMGGGQTLDRSQHKGAVLVVGVPEGVTLEGERFSFGEVVVVTANPGRSGGQRRFRKARAGDKIRVEQEVWAKGYNIEAGALKLPESGRLALMTPEEMKAANITIEGKKKPVDPNAGVGETWLDAKVAWFEFRVPGPQLKASTGNLTERDFDKAAAALKQAVQADNDAGRRERAKQRQWIEWDDKVEDGGRLVRVYLFRDSTPDWPSDDNETVVEVWGSRPLLNNVEVNFDLTLDGRKTGKGQIEGSATGRLKYDKFDFSFSEATFKLVTQSEEDLATDGPKDGDPDDGNPDGKPKPVDF